MGKKNDKLIRAKVHLNKRTLQPCLNLSKRFLKKNFPREALKRGRQLMVDLRIANFGELDLEDVKWGLKKK